MDSIFFGQIIFNISIILYCVQFIPQIIHNYKNKNSLSNISVLTQLGIFITVLCDIIQTISFGYEWQYATVAIIYLIGVSIQQLQISIFHKKLPEIVNFSFIILFMLALLAMGSDNEKIYSLIEYIGFIVNTLYWLPQIYKNHKQKRADGFCLCFILIALIGTSLYIASSFILSWGPTFTPNALIILPALIILLVQKFYYKK
ncbi:PQ-loop repeat-containing protein [Francisella philomiragia]|uniref:PQ-loop repeat-containing protein n=1 Tax=Francisella philomiragia TaxID=28110 RepID=UPI0005A575C3|nr:PQ-loop repeat-containing protein [Francisella philomiragia]AJI54808.1 ER lumen retaining receptor family protein [Francisella philomiragia]AJI57777.1 ER lumen retaining receptor family protein [Francisella philomiragia]MBK2253279.1 PQ-loop repeat-containing protein [Francisella philomiragia]MBK2296287.1 PQ-loop repeat-containing protein [Francisella philomiragia]MBK2340754.1 PQ-loop repeat-containing protein [Francisella philomiragia]